MESLILPHVQLLRLRVHIKLYFIRILLSTTSGVTANITFINERQILKMIRHIVMFSLLDEAEGKTKAENLTEAVKKAEALRTKVPSLRKYSVVTNSPEADATNYDISLICDFDDMKGLSEYQNHPDHKEFGKFICAVRKSRACIDFEV